MGKLIIENKTRGLSDYQCLDYIKQVIGEGRISKEGKQYCYLTAFNKAEGGQYIVATDLNKRSDRFIIYDGK